MSYSRAASFETSRSLAFGSIVSGYTIIGTAFYYPVRILLVQNLTDGLLQFSDDGVNDKFVLDTGDKVIFDFCANLIDETAWFLPANKAIYVKRIDTPTTRFVSVSAVYGKND